MLQLNQIGAGLVRTIVPLVVAYLANLGLVKGLGLTDDQLTNAVSLVIAAIYWLAARAFEVYVSPKFSRLLGTKASPVYVQSDEAGLYDVTSLPPAGE